MIIAIDETGSFNLDNTEDNYFFGVHFPDLEEVKKMSTDLAAWENQYRSCKDGKGEIKGHSIDETMANDFVENVIIPRKNFYITAISVLPIENKKRDIQHYRDSFVKSMDKAIYQIKQVNNLTLAGRYEIMRNWFKKLSYHQMLKIKMLSEMVGFSFREHLIQVVILDRQDNSLNEIKIEMDKDFVREPDHIIFWKEFLRNSLYFFSMRNPIPTIAEWPDDHPFYKIFGKDESLVDDCLIGKESIFRDNCNFYNSHECPEIRVADIIASITRRFFSSGEFSVTFDKLSKYFIPFREEQRIKRLRIAPYGSEPMKAKNPHK